MTFDFWLVFWFTAKMFFRLFLLFTLIPLIELYLLITVGSYLGAGLTIFVVLGTGMAGAYVARLEGWRTWQKIQHELQNGVVPANELIDGVLILAAGLLLITPGILTDVVGFSLLLPPTRAALKIAIRRALEKRVQSTDIEVHFDRLS
jgi:UPF0716 protein FxsA